MALDPAAVRAALAAPQGGRSRLGRVEVVASTASTSTDLVAAATTAATAAPSATGEHAPWPDRSVLVADHQVAGRGRAARTWTTPAGTALTFSVLSRPGVDPGRVGWAGLLGGLAVVDALRGLGLDAVLKWPNDVLLPAADALDGWGRYRKVAGVLGELVTTPTGPAVVLGIGINVSQVCDELPVPHATSLALAGTVVDRVDLLARVLDAWVRLDDLWREHGGDAAGAGLLDRCSRVCVTLGALVRAELPGGEVVEGWARALADDGALVVALEGGGERSVHAGDVLLRTVQALDEPQVLPSEQDEDASLSPTLARLEELLLGGRPTLSLDVLAQRLATPVAELEQLWRALGLVVPDRSAVTFTEADAAVIGSAQRARAEFEIAERSALSLVRAIGHTTERLVTWQVEALVEHMAARYRLDDTTARILVLDRLGDVAPLMELQLVHAWRRQLTAAAGRLTRDYAQAGLIEASQDLPLARAVGFADIVAFTRRSAGLGSAALAELVGEFEATARDAVTSHGGRVVKTIGDAVMFVADDPVTGAAVALALAETFGVDSATPVRVGMTWGRVISRFGDVFGPSVNVASRMTRQAAPGSVMVDPSTAVALAQAPGLALAQEGEREVAGLGPVTPFRLGRG